MKEVIRRAEFLMMGTDSFSYMQRIEKAVAETFQMLRADLITESECIGYFNKKMGC